jgi:hypothetical protein
VPKWSGLGFTGGGPAMVPRCQDGLDSVLPGADRPWFHGAKMVWTRFYRGRAGHGSTVPGSFACWQAVSCRQWPRIKLWPDMLPATTPKRNPLQTESLPHVGTAVRSSPKRNPLQRRRASRMSGQPRAAVLSGIPSKRRASRMSGQPRACPSGIPSISIRMSHIDLER